MKKVDQKMNRTDPLAGPVPKEFCERPPVWFPNGNGTMTPQRRVEWSGDLPLGFTVRKMNGLWVCAKIGAYFDTDEVVEKIRETVEFWEAEDVVETIRLDLGLVS